MTATVANGDERQPLLSRKDEAVDDPTLFSPLQRNLILFACWLAVFLGALDLTLVASILSDVSSSFKQSNQASWLGTSYLLSTATFTPLLCDIIGRRGTMLIALVLFTSGTALCGFAPSMQSLIIGRLIAGMGGGGVMSTSSVIASDLVPLKRRALFQGIANIFFGAGSGLGGPLGGFISDTIGWRWAFIVQVPLLAISIVLCFLLVRYRMPGQGRTKMEMVRRIDYGGAVTLILSLGSLLFGLSFKNNENLPWGNPLVWGSLVFSAVTLVCFILVEANYAAEPVLPFRIFKQRNGIFVCLANFGASWCSFSVLFFYPMFFEVVKMQSASRSGAHLLPNSVALSCGSLFAGFVIRKTGKYRFLISFTALGPVFSLACMALLNKNSNVFLTWIAIVPSGFGFAVLITAGLIALIAAVERSEMATSTGLTYLWRYVGQVVGVAVSSSLLQAVLTSTLQKRITGPDAHKIIERIRTEASSIRELPPALQVQAIDSYATALRAVYLFTLGVAVVTFLTTLPIQEFPLPDSFAEEEEQRRQRDNNSNNHSGTSTPHRDA